MHKTFDFPHAFELLVSLTQSVRDTVFLRWAGNLCADQLHVMDVMATAADAVITHSVRQ